MKSKTRISHKGCNHPATTAAYAACQEGRDAALAPDDPRHRTRAGYGAGCREECCKAAAREYQKAQRAKDPERFRERQKAYRERQRERRAVRRKQNQARWAVEDARANPEPKRCPACGAMKPRTEFTTAPSFPDGLFPRCKACWDAPKKRRAMKMAAPRIETINRDVLYARDAGICYLCGVGVENVSYGWHLEHRIPLVRGGSHTYENVAVACMDCNLAKGKMTEEEFRASSRFKMVEVANG